MLAGPVRAARRTASRIAAAVMHSPVFAGPAAVVGDAAGIAPDAHHLTASRAMRASTAASAPPWFTHDASRTFT